MMRNRLISLWVVFSLLWLGSVGWWASKNWQPRVLPGAIAFAEKLDAACVPHHQDDWCDGTRGSDADPRVEDAARRTAGGLLLLATFGLPIALLILGDIAFRVAAYRVDDRDSKS
jgi:hypothetical protein